MANDKTSFWQNLKTRFPMFTASARTVTVAPEQVVSVRNAATDFGVSVNCDTAMKNTAFFAGIRIISENIASLPKAIRKSTERGMVDAPEHPAHRVIAIAPNSYTNSFSFWACIVTWIKGWGNAYALIERNAAGAPAALHQIHPSCVAITMVKGRKWYKISLADPNRSYLNGVYPDNDMLHFMEVSFDGVKGVNPVFYNAAALGKSLATEKFAAEFYKKGGNIRAVMEADGQFSDDEYETFMRHFQSSSNNYDTPLLEYGIKYKQLSVDPVAAALIQSETLSIQDVCRILNIPPHMVAELSHATFSNIEHQTIQFVQYSLRPVIKRIEIELERKLFFDDEQGVYDVKFILDGLLRGDTSTRATYYHNAILDGYMSRNEVRALEGLESADGLDQFLYPQNEGVVGNSNN